VDNNKGQVNVMKILNTHILSLTLIIICLLSLVTLTTLIPKTLASETTNQTLLPISLPTGTVSLSANELKGLAILSNVVGIDLSKYTISSVSSPNKYLGVIEEESVCYQLHSNDGSLEFSCTFTGGNLRKINLLNNNESSDLTTISDAFVENSDSIKSAQTFLNNYYKYSADSFYLDLSAMLDGINEQKNSTQTYGTVKLEVLATDGSTVFRWIYTANDMDASSKSVALRYKNGYLKYFIDTWNLYQIGSTEVKVSEKQAIDIAMEAARASSWNMGTDNKTVKITGFTVANAMISENTFASNIYADQPRSEDPLMLYPVRSVWVSLDKFYPGNVYGFNVYVWADTGEVCSINERISTMDPVDNSSIATPSDYKIEPISDKTSADISPLNNMLTTVSLCFGMVVVGSLPVLILLNKKQKLPKSGIFKIMGILLCFLMLSLLLLSIPAVSAVPTRRGLIWGSESTGNTDCNGASGRKTSDEINRQRVTSNAINNYLKDDQYVADNYQGSQSTKSSILTQIDYASSYSKTVVFDFDHGVYRPDYIEDPGVVHYMFEDNVGSVSGVDANGADPNNWVNTHMVYDLDIYLANDGWNPCFAYINTCLSANLTYQNAGNAVGMPFGLLDCIVVSNPSGNYQMSNDGYNNPDSGAHCFMGFVWGSASLSQTITGVSPIYATWLENFAWYALIGDRSINNALDEASQDNFGQDFDATTLATNFGAQWPMWSTTLQQWVANPYYNSKLVVYGNGNMHLYEYFVQDCLSASGSNGGVDNADNIENENDGQYAHLYASYPGQAVVDCSVGWAAKGHIYLYGYSTVTSYVRVYVSSDNSNWQSVNSFTVNSASANWIDVGNYANNFNYIAIVVYPYGNFYVDSVLVIPP
jgi:hypothetical protein